METPECDWVTAQARLLTNRRLRSAFRADPAAVATELNIAPAERALFVAADPDQLDAQAEGLLRKRLHEARGLLPETFASLGEQADQLFVEYAEGFWPTGHRRHPMDALRFAEFLKSGGLRPCDEACLNLLAFEERPSGCNVRWVRSWPTGQGAVQVLFRWRGRVRQWLLRLG